MWPFILSDRGQGRPVSTGEGHSFVGKDVLLLAFVSLSRELVRLRQALEWRQ